MNHTLDKINSTLILLCQLAIILTEANCRMKKIHFTKSEYRILLDLIYITDWILHSHDPEDQSNTQEYSNLFSKINVLCQGHGLRGFG